MPLQYVLYTIDGPQRYDLELQQDVVVLLLLCIPSELQRRSLLTVALQRKRMTSVQHKEH